MVFFPQSNSFVKRHKTHVTLFEEGDFLIERALIRRAKLKAQEESSDSDDAPVFKGQVRPVWSPRAREAWGSLESCDAPVQQGHVFAQKRSRSVLEERDSNVTRRASKMLNRLGSSPVDDKAIKSLEGLESHPEQTSSRFDRLVGRIRGDVNDFRYSLHSLLKNADEY
eukprot:gnl/MRDRNA2_/MRDRNA2_88110_c0_seq1.p1 gnl/MRDRNA2_/MRDRNA2_88110_c0~~gnl/MRDRNA2_/MRDRNA2_88110_c0_seq1.p1  ORF type:complete len:168 (-),score=27.82 gnl/MRDRNA2_/MRDRNA2_88110_c0_seq1:374-877(-)